MNVFKGKLEHFVLGVFFSCVSIVSAAEDKAALVNKAKEERVLAFYSSVEHNQNTALLQAFQKQYVFIEPKLLRLGSNQMAVRIFQEHRAGIHPFDVLITSGFEFYQVLKTGLLQKYDSPERRAFLDDFRDKEGMWTSSYHNAGIIAYNTNLVKPADVPRSYEDLLHPKWKGKMLLDNREIEWYATMLQILGREKGLRLMKGLAKQDLSFRAGRVLITQALAAGEAALAVNTNDHLVREAQKKGAPVESVAVYPTTSRIMAIGLGRYAPHPSAGKLFIDFVLSEEGQKILRSFGRSSSRRGIEPDELQKRGVKLYVSDMSLSDDYARYSNEFRELFGVK